MNQQDKLSEITRRIVETCNPEKIILFGSYARGTAQADSDVDLLIILPKIQHQREESLRIRRSLRGLLVPVDILLATTEQIERLGEMPGLIYRTALQEGKVLYERT